jgi:hypothetical protein
VSFGGVVSFGQCRVAGAPRCCVAALSAVPVVGGAVLSRCGVVAVRRCRRARGVVAARGAVTEGVEYRVRGLTAAAVRRFGCRSPRLRRLLGRCGLCGSVGIEGRRRRPRRVASSAACPRAWVASAAPGGSSARSGRGGQGVRDAHSPAHSSRIPRAFFGRRRACRLRASALPNRDSLRCVMAFCDRVDNPLSPLDPYVCHLAPFHHTVSIAQSVREEEVGALMKALETVADRHLRSQEPYGRTVTHGVLALSNGTRRSTTRSNAPAGADALRGD